MNLEPQEQNQLKDIPTQTPAPKTNWLDEELKDIESKNIFDGEKKPALKFEENKITEFEIDIDEPWKEWEDVENKTMKAIIPCKQGETDCIWWLNKRNPVYRDVVNKASFGITKLKVMQTGTLRSTRYNLVEEDKEDKLISPL
jgi:hypothetical protein